MFTELNYRILLDEYFIRQEILKSCKTQEEKDKWLDRWVIEDSAENIANAVRASNRSRFLGLF